MVSGVFWPGIAHDCNHYRPRRSLGGQTPAAWFPRAESNSRDPRQLDRLTGPRHLQLLRLARFGLWAASGWRAAGRIWGDLHGKKLLIGAGIAATTAVAVVYLSESAEPDSSIHSVETTLWWAVTTVTTVGYGDTSPVTPEGRIAAAALMVAGISMFGLVTANVSARFVSKHRDTTCPHCGRSPR